MALINTSIIPASPTFVKIKEAPHELDYKAICVFTALGFFLGTDTYWKNEKVLAPASINTIDEDGFLIKSESWFKWYHKPRNIDLYQATKEFEKLFEKIISEQGTGKNNIVPLSGGLDSRTQAVALKKLKLKVNSYSYSFENGYKESSISKSLAKVGGFSFSEYVIPKSYLWDKIDSLAKINNCYSEFTHPRQMAVIDEVAKLGECFSLGHWGDVLFDSENYNTNLSDQELCQILKKKIVKDSGMELANSLWESWKLDGSFESYLNDRVLGLLNKIDIKNSSAKIRAFKSMYWAPRWTSVNLSIFETMAPIHLPYYDDRMCEFICELPEEILSNRKVQIAYIKKNNKAMAEVVWQDAKPFNLYNSHLSKIPFNIPYRILNKLKRLLNSMMGNNFIQRNWELQLVGEENNENLIKYLFSKDLTNIINSEVVEKYYNLFTNTNKVYYSHSVSMLLTLSVFFKGSKNE